MRLSSFTGNLGTAVALVTAAAGVAGWNASATWSTLKLNALPVNYGSIATLNTSTSAVTLKAGVYRTDFQFQQDASSGLALLFRIQGGTSTIAKFVNTYSNYYYTTNGHGMGTCSTYFNLAADTACTIQILSPGGALAAVAPPDSSGQYQVAAQACFQRIG